MAYTVEQLRKWSTARELPDGRWVPARPIVGPFRWRLRDAWQVLWGKMDAVKWEP